MNMKEIEASIENLTHQNIMIVITNQAELACLIEWYEMRGVLPPWLGPRDKFPIAVSPNGGGWTDHMDRALFYIPFITFVEKRGNV